MTDRDELLKSHADRLHSLATAFETTGNSKVTRLLRESAGVMLGMVSPNRTLDIGDAISVAQGCFDYSGGYRDEMLDAFHGGIQTVVNALKAAKQASDNGVKDTQVEVLKAIGNQAPFTS